MSHPSGCLYAAYRATALLLGSQPAPAGMCCSAALWLPTLGYTFDSFAPAQLALRANLRLVYLAPAPALDCLSPRNKCAIARVLLRFAAAKD